MAYVAPPENLVAVWRRHRDECQGLGHIVKAARDGRLPGVEKADARHETFIVKDRMAALAAMRKAS